MVDKRTRTNVKKGGAASQELIDRKKRLEETKKKLQRAKRSASAASNPLRASATASGRAALKELRKQKEAQSLQERRDVAREVRRLGVLGGFESKLDRWQGSLADEEKERFKIALWAIKILVPFIIWLGVYLGAKLKDKTDEILDESSGGQTEEEKEEEGGKWWWKIYTVRQKMMFIWGSVLIMLFTIIKWNPFSKMFKSSMWGSNGTLKRVVDLGEAAGVAGAKKALKARWGDVFTGYWWLGWMSAIAFPLVIDIIFVDSGRSTTFAYFDELSGDKLKNTCEAVGCHGEACR